LFHLINGGSTPFQKEIGLPPVSLRGFKRARKLGLILGVPEAFRVFLRRGTPPVLEERGAIF